MRGKLNRLKLCVTILLILEILIGILLICMTASYHRVLVAYLAKTERQMLLGQLYNVYVLGFQLLVIYSVGLILWRFIWNSEMIVEHTKLLAAWNGFCLLIIICGSVTVWFLHSSIEYLQYAAAASLFEGMDLYFSDPDWKLLWDEIQYYNQCCGVNGYEDWKEAAWMPEEQTKCPPTFDSNILMLIPYACCKRTATFCFKIYAPHLTAVPLPYLNSTDINTNGCLPKFNNTTYQLFFSLASMMVIVFILQILLLIFEFTTMSKAKKLLFCGRDYSDNNDERPLVVVKYPRNVRCITLTDEENFDEVDEDEEDHHCLHKYRASPTKGISVQQEVTDTRDRNKSIFLH